MEEGDNLGSKVDQDTNYGCELPRLNVIKKSLNLSPRRKIITLVLPKVELSPRSNQRISIPRLHKSKNSEIPRHLSMSVECTNIKRPEDPRRSPIKSSINNFLMSLDDQKSSKSRRTRLSSLQIKLNERLKQQKSIKTTKMSSKSIQHEEISIKGESKPTKHIPSNPQIESKLCTMACAFRDLVESKYNKLFDDIDINKKGSIILDDFINMIILKGLGENSEKEESYITVKKKASDIFNLFYSVCSKSRIMKKDFFAVCSVYEYFSPDMQPDDFLKIENLPEVKLKINDLKQVFEFYCKDGAIDMKQFKSILACVQVDGIGTLTDVIFVEAVGFVQFLSFLPLFLWVHQEVTGQINAEREKMF